MGGLGLLLVFFFSNFSIGKLFSNENPILLQTSIGLLYGSLVAVFSIVLMSSPMLKEVPPLFENMVARLNPNFVAILFLSFAAGVGEELLFRAAIQPHLGIWLTSLLFVLVHFVYLNPFDLKMSILGVFLVLISAGFGYLFKLSGIYAAISAHFIYDVIIFSKLKYGRKA